MERTVRTYKKKIMKLEWIITQAKKCLEGKHFTDREYRQAISNALQLLEED